MSERIHKLLIIVLITLGMFIAAELLARILLWSPPVPPTPPVGFGYSTGGYGDLRPNIDSVELIYPLRPYHLYTNSVGLRNVDELDDNPAVFRILAIGDSFTFGFYVHNEETWPARLEEVLNQIQSRRVQVLNAGVPGYTIADSLAYLRDKGLALEPDMVILGFYTNDIFDMEPVMRQYFARDVVLRQAQPIILAEQNPVRQWMENNLALYGVIQRWRGQVTEYRIEGQVASITPTIAGLHETYQNLTFIMPDAYPDAWTAYESSLRETITLLREEGIPFVIVAFPDLAQLPVEGGFGDPPQQMMARITTDTDTPYLDMLPIFRESGDIQNLYLMYYDPDILVDTIRPDAGSLSFTGDGHLSRYGYLLTARILAAFLIERDWIPAN